MVVLDLPFIYHPEDEGEARGQGKYMNGVSRTTMVDVSFSESRGRYGKATMVLHIRDLAMAGPSWTNAQLLD